MENNKGIIKTGKRKILKNLLLVLLVVFAGMQFFQPDKNNQNPDMTHDISTVVGIPDTIHSILKTSCYDCHSNQTKYPWYANIQPAGWWLKDHIEEGKDHLNFQEFALLEGREGSKFNTKKLRQDHKLEEISEQLEAHEMPLTSYTLIHRNAKLSEEQEKMIMNWVNAARNELTADTISNN